MYSSYSRGGPKKFENMSNYFGYRHKIVFFYFRDLFAETKKFVFSRKQKEIRKKLFRLNSSFKEAG